MSSETQTFSTWSPSVGHWSLLNLSFRMAALVNMMMLISLVPGCLADNWAVLIAGSNSFYNYRHQSDVCHAFQILRKGGIPASNIVVLMYDDIARSSENPFHGQIFNKPNGTDVYKGVTIDYSGTAVNKTTFLKVLRGDESAGGKVLKSTQNDDVFIYYSDHGATGLVCMPSGDDLHADELLSGLKFMHRHKMYRRLVFYLEACESGSMFQGVLPSNMNIFATSAANSDESSYAYYYWQPVGTYLGDEYSIRWMEDSDLNLFKHESLRTQFIHVRTQVKKSHPQSFGTKAWVNESISDFEGERTSVHHPSQRRPLRLSDGQSISSRDAKLLYIMNKYAVATGNVKDHYHKLVHIELEYRALVRRHVRSLVENVIRVTNSRLSADTFMAEYKAPRDFDCLRTVKREFGNFCEPLVEYGLTFVKNLVQLCETFEMLTIRTEIRNVCISATKMH